MLLQTVFRPRAGAGLLALAGLLGTAWAQTGDSIALHYHQRVPYEYLQDGKVQGLIATPVEKAFKKAGIPFHWVPTPITRQFDLIKNNLGQDCTSGRFQNKERAQWARFSKPVYRGRPSGLIVRSDNTALRAYTSLESALESSSVRLLVKSGYSYGPVVDRFIAQRSVPPISTFDESQDMLRQIHRGMADTFIISGEEAQGLLASSNLPDKDLVFLPFPDAPVRELRYVMCSLNVPPEVITRLNAAIEFKDR